MMTANETPVLADRIKPKWLTAPDLKAVFAALSADGDEVRVVGGAVRNSLLGKPVKDIDLATTARPEKVIELARKARLKALPTGLAHGTVTVCAGLLQFEVTTLRKDIATDGRHADVKFTDNWEKDALRRDFTINALSLAYDGQLYDPLNAGADIAAHRICFIGDPSCRIREDHLRILRFFRLHAEYGRGEIDPQAVMACIQERTGLRHLSAERILSELLKLLMGPAAIASLTVMFEAGLLVSLLGTPPSLAHFEKLTKLEELLARKGDAILRLAVLTIRVSEDGERLFTRFKLRNQDRTLLCKLPKLCRKVSPRRGVAEAKAALYRWKKDLYQAVILYGWCLSGEDESDQEWRILYDLPGHWDIPDFPLRGEDILALGVAPGPRIGDLLRRLEGDWIREGFRHEKPRLIERAKLLADS